MDLTGRGRVVLPAAYLGTHVEYGWAATIDAAQGATADVGIVLVRPGMDRAHPDVAITRGRHGNHAYITPDLTTGDDHPGAPPRNPPSNRCAARGSRRCGCSRTRSGPAERRTPPTKLEHACIPAQAQTA